MFTFFEWHTQQYVRQSLAWSLVLGLYVYFF